MFPPTQAAPIQNSQLLQSAGGKQAEAEQQKPQILGMGTGAYLRRLSRWGRESRRGSRRGAAADLGRVSGGLEARRFLFLADSAAEKGGSRLACPPA